MYWFISSSLHLVHFMIILGFDLYHIVLKNTSVVFSMYKPMDTITQEISVSFFLPVTSLFLQYF